MVGMATMTWPTSSTVGNGRAPLLRPLPVDLEDLAGVSRVTIRVDEVLDSLGQA